MSQNGITSTTTNSKVRHITPPKEELQSLPSSFYNCDICGLQVKTQSNLRAHFIKTHGLVNDAKDIAFLLRKKTDISDVFHCPAPACKYTKSSGVGFSKFWHLKQHYQLVHMKKTFQCATCGQRFSTPSAQAYHAKSCGTHFECPVCGRKYKAKKFLNQHARRSGHDVRARASASRTTPVVRQQSSFNLPTESVLTTAENGQREAQTPTRLAILPLLILPLGVGTDQASISAATTSAASLVGEVIAQLRTNLTVPPVVSTPSTSSVGGCPGPAVQLNSLAYSPEAQRPAFALSNSIANRGGGDDSAGGPTFVPLVDVGTATLRLSHAHTQTDVNVPPNCPVPAPTAAVTAQQTDFVVFYNNQMTRDSYTATSPPDCHLATVQMSVGNSPPPAAFLADMSHSSTYISPGHSIELQYPEMNSNGTMTTYHSQQPPQAQHHAFQQTTVIPTTAVSSTTGASLYLPSDTSEGGCYNAFAATGSSTSPYSGEWRNLRRPDGQSANSVAVETTLDLANFDASNSGNCYWPPAESFAHMQTQTVCDADDLEQWFNNVQTQTSTAAASTQQQSSWTSLFANDGVCVGVNTEMLMTPEHGGSP